METVQVMLVGGRQTPNLIGAYLLHPDRVELAVSIDEKEKVKPLLEALSGLSDPPKTPSENEIGMLDAHDYEANVNFFTSLCEKHTGKSIQFNLTGSTKIMAFAAYDSARQYQGTQAFYVDTSNSRLLWLVGKNEAHQPFHLSIQEYLRAYGRVPKPKNNFSTLSFDLDTAINISSLFATNIHAARYVLHNIRKSQGKGKRRISLKDPGTSEIVLVSNLVEAGVIDGSDDFGFIVRSNVDWNFFTGGWLELYIWDQARQQKDKNGNNLFDECTYNLEIPSEKAKKEIDVCCLYQAQLIHCSCKTEAKSLETENLDELSAVSSLIGGRFCSRLFITSQDFHDDEQKGKFMAQAGQREIVVIVGSQLIDAGKILARQAEKPDYWRM